MRFYALYSQRNGTLATGDTQSARNQDKFHEMHSLLFENQKQWSTSSNPAMAIVNYAREIGLDINQFTDDLNAAETQETVMEQKEEGADMGVSSTPTFFIDGEEVDPLPKNYEEFKTLVEKRLQEKQG